MDVSPMNLQMMVPRSADVGQVQSNMNQQINLEQDFQAVQQKNDDKLKEQQVRHKDNPEDGRIKDDADGHNGQGASAEGNGSKSDSDLDESDQEKYAADPNRGNLLDIRL